MNKELAKIEEQKEFTITVFGDSIAKGVYLDEELKIQKLDKTLTSILEHRCELQIDNKSVFGQTLKRIDEKKMIESYLTTIDPMKENIVILWIGGNDSDYNWEEVVQSPLKDHSSKTSLIEFETLLTDTLKILLDANCIPVLFTLVPINSERYFQNVLSKKYNQENLLLFLNNDLTNLSRHQESFNNSILKIGSKMNVITVDIRQMFLNEIKLNDYLCNDGIHPNEQAQELLYQYLFLYSNSYGKKFRLHLKDY